MLFMSYSFLGWCIEVILKFIQYKRFINRGFLIGPWLSIYGWGALLITILLQKYSNDPIAFENPFKGEDGTEIILKEGKASIVMEDTEIQGTYHWDTKEDDYYIHVKGKIGDEDIEYWYRANEDGGSLCLLKEGECLTIYLPVE